MKIKDIIGKEICVKCSTEQEFRSFLKAVEKLDMTWTFGDRPTQHYEYWENRPIYIECFEGNAKCSDFISCSEYAFCDTIVDFSALDLSDNYSEKYQLEIKQKNRSVIATLYDNKGAFIKYAKAKCSPEDKFDFEVGKKIALQRLLDIKSDETSFSQKLELKWSGFSYGIVGEPTQVEAYGHIKLYIGDVVELFDNVGKSWGLHSVCKDPKDETDFIMGIRSAKFTNGQGFDGCSNWLIVKRKSHIEMNAGDVIGVIEYTLI